MITIKHNFKCDFDPCSNFREVEYKHSIGEQTLIPSLPEGWTRIYPTSAIICQLHEVTHTYTIDGKEYKF